jgi:hypothetical protein
VTAASSSTEGKQADTNSTGGNLGGAADKPHAHHQPPADAKTKSEGML